ncbi:MAG: DegQ family serine endoprotease, partial [Candidatus Midichloria sp.]
IFVQVCLLIDEYLKVKSVKKFLLPILLSVCLLAKNANAGAIPPASFSEVIEKSMPAVVNISTSTSQKVIKKRQQLDMGNPYDILRDLFEREFGLNPYSGEQAVPPRKAISLGSGFIVDPSGYIVTNNHVIDEADEINVTLSGENGLSYKAKLIGKDSKTDLAVLKIDVENNLPFIKFGDSDKAKVGDLILVIGNPFGLGGSVSLGIISAKARNINSGHFDDFIQTDAAINVGNSGGPMLNTEGEVIGVNSVILSPSKGNIGIGFAIPSNMVQYVFKQLKEKGKIVRGQLGVTIQDIEKGLADDLGLKGIRGALVSGVLKGSPAERAGIKIGDVITKLDGKVITSASQLPRLVGEIELNKKANLEIFRDGKIINIQANVEKSKEEDTIASNDVEVAKNTSVFGMQVQTINSQLIKKFNLRDNAKGVLVTGVERGSLAAMIGIRVGDIVISVNKKEVATAKEFDAITSNIKKSGKGSATFLIARGESTFFVSLEDN